MDYWHLKQNINKLNIYDIATTEDINSIDFKNKNAIIFCQSYEQTEDSKLIFELFKKNNFIYTTSNAIKGVKLSLIKKANPN